MVEAAVDKPPVVPNFSCRRRTSRGGFATEFTNAILTCLPARINTRKHQDGELVKDLYMNTKAELISVKHPNWIKPLLPFGLLACAEEMFWVSSLNRSSRSSWSLRYNSLHDSYSWGVSRLKSRWQWRIQSSSESSVNH